MGLLSVLGLIANTTKGIVDDMSGETDRLRNQIVVEKQAMQATVVRAEGVTPILPVYEQLKTRYLLAKQAFEKIENDPDSRPALAAQAQWKTAAERLAAVRDAHDLQHAAMTAVSDWQGVHAKDLKAALEAKGLPVPAQKPHADLVEANKALTASLAKPDYVEAQGLVPALDTKLTEFIQANSKPPLAPDHRAVREATQSGDLRTQLRNPKFLKETNEWMDKADPVDPEQRKDMLAVLKALDPADGAARKKAFERTFKGNVVTSTTRKYVPMMDKKTGKQKLDGDKKPIFNEIFDKNAPIDPVALEAMAEVMAQLPTKHMPSKWMFLGQDGDDNTRGSYDDRSDGADLAFSLKDAANGFKQEYASNCAPGDPLEKAKAFDVMIRHECGHKAASVVGSDALTDMPAGGEWIHHNTVANVLTAIDSVFKDYVVKLQNGTAKPTELAVHKAVCNEEFGLMPEAIAESLGIDESRAQSDHQLFKVLHQGAHKKYQCGTSPESIGGRMYVVGGPEEGSWYSFAKSAWDRRVSLYQYAAPNEWFAEFYATANNGDENVRSEAKSRFPDAWNWLEAHDCIVVVA